jgi:spore coat protein CotH
VNANGNYRGLYCLMERVDRKQLKLKKMKDGEVRGILYKSVNWKNGFFSAALDPYDLQSETWGCYEIQFPDTAGYVPWQPLYDAMEFAGKSDDELYMQQVALRYDLPVFMDLYLFYALLSARDCMGKNTFLSYYNIPKDSMLVPTPWDMDHSFGRMYNGNEEDSRKAFTGWAPKLYTRLERLDPTYTVTLNARYAALRHEEFDARRLKQRFAQYFELFRQTGVDKREERRWSGVNSIDLDFAAEELYIYEWIDQRLAYCDSIFDYVSEVTTALPKEVNPSTAMDTEPTTVTKQLINGHLYLRKGEQLYDLQGRRVK